MEYGLISNIGQYADNKKIQIQQIQPSNEIAKLANGDESKEVSNNSLLDEVNESSNVNASKTKKVSAQEISEYQEVVLTNLNFGYNSSSQDFYVKAVRGENESQFPTDDMMRIKAYFIAEAKNAVEI